MNLTLLSNTLTFGGPAPRPVKPYLFEPNPYEDFSLAKRLAFALEMSSPATQAKIKATTARIFWELQNNARSLNKKPLDERELISQTAKDLFREILASACAITNSVAAATKAEIDASKVCLDDDMDGLLAELNIAVDPAATSIFQKIIRLPTQNLDPAIQNTIYDILLATHLFHVQDGSSGETRPLIQAFSSARSLTDAAVSTLLNDIEASASDLKHSLDSYFKNELDALIGFTATLVALSILSPLAYQIVLATLDCVAKETLFSPSLVLLMIAFSVVGALTVKPLLIASISGANQAALEKDIVSQVKHFKNTIRLSTETMKIDLIAAANIKNLLDKTIKDIQDTLWALDGNFRYRMRTDFSDQLHEEIFDSFKSQKLIDDTINLVVQRAEAPEPLI